MNTPNPASPKRSGVICAGWWDERPDPRATEAAAPTVPAAGAEVVALTLARLGAAFPVAGLDLAPEPDPARWSRLASAGIEPLRPTAAAAWPELADRPHKIFHLACAPDAGAGWVEHARQAKSAGLRLSLGIPAGNIDGLAAAVLGLLPACDYLFAGADQALQLTGAFIDPDARRRSVQIEQAAEQLLAAGVARWVVIHHPRAVFACNHGGFAVWQPTVRTRAVTLPPWAADTFTGGLFFALHDHWPMDEALKIGVAALHAFVKHGCNAALLPALNETVALALGAGHGPAIKRGVNTPL